MNKFQLGDLVRQLEGASHTYRVVATYKHLVWCEREDGYSLHTFVTEDLKLVKPEPKPGDIVSWDGIFGDRAARGKVLASFSDEDKPYLVIRLLGKPPVGAKPARPAVYRLDYLQGANLKRLDYLQGANLPIIEEDR